MTDYIVALFVYILVLAREKVTAIISDSSELDCGFGLYEQCRWRNGTNGQEDNFDWMIANAVIYDSWHSIPRSKDGTAQDYFTFVRGDSTLAQNDTALLISDTIPCQTGVGTLRFWYWKTAIFPSLKICIIQPPAELNNIPGSSHSGYPGGRRGVQKRQADYDPQGTIITPQPSYVGSSNNINSYNTGNNQGYPGPSSGGGGYPSTNNNNNYNNNNNNYGGNLQPSGGYGTEPPYYPEYEPVKPHCIEEITGSHRQEWAWKTVVLPAEKEPFQLAFLANFRNHHDIIGLDDIEYSAPICGGSNQVQTGGRVAPTDDSIPYGAGQVSPGSSRSPVERRDCPAVNCNFDLGNSCRYSEGTSLPGARQWRVSETQVANSLTGIPKDVSGSGRFAFAGGSESGVSKEDLFVLETGQFATSTDGTFHFSYYQAGIEGRLRICLDSISDCPFDRLGKDIKVDCREWKAGQIDVPEGTHKIIIIADQLQKNYVIGLDELVLRESTGLETLGCSNIIT